jgi:Cof subfamily protein (haloacid dehalogenase superfamily)
VKNSVAIPQESSADKYETTINVRNEPTAMQNIKLLICDLDGTLLDDGKSMSARTIETFQRARAKGLKLCLASGRHESMMSVYAELLGGCDYLLSCNGAMLRRMRDTILLRKQTLDDTQLQRMLSVLIETEMGFTLYTEDKAFYDARRPELAERYERFETLTEQMGRPVRLRARALTEQNFSSIQQAVKLVVFSKDGQRRQTERIWRMVDETPELMREATGYGLTGIFARGVDKRAALQATLTDARIGTANICVFGDYDNDLSMFSLAGRSVAVANARASVTCAATDLTADNNDDGVARFVERILQAQAEPGRSRC